MRTKLAIPVLAVFILTGCGGRTPDARGVLNSAAKTMGAKDLHTIEFSGSGSQFVLGQAVLPYDPLPGYNLQSFDYVADYVRQASRVQAVRTQDSSQRHGGAFIAGEVRDNAYLNGEYAWIPGAGGAPARQPAGDGLDADIVEQRQIELWETPHGFLTAALESNAATLQEQIVDGKRFRIVSFPRGKTKMDGYIDDQNLVEKVETWMPHPVLGDMLVETSFSGYRDWGGVKFPARIREKWAGETVMDLTIGEVKPNVSVDLSVPDAVRNTPLPPPAKILTRQVGPGLVVIAGQNCGTILVEFKDFLVAVEGPTNEDRSLAVLQEIKRLYPSKPVRYLINTHNHYNDHAGGIRTWAAAGIPIITHKDNQKWLEEVAFQGTWTIRPDQLSQLHVKPVIEPVDDSRVITDGTRKMILYHLRGNIHSGSMLIAYLPAEKTILEADVFTANGKGGALFGPDVPPPGAPPDFPRCCDARNFYDNVQRLKLNVTTLLPVHSITRGDKGPVPWETFLAYLGKSRKS